MSGRCWTVEECDAHAARLKDLWRDPAYQERQRAIREARKARPAAATHESIIPPSVYDRRLDLGPLPTALHDDVIADPPTFEVLA